MSIQNVAVIGGGGNIGTPIVKALLDTKFNVTVLTRTSSKSTFPPGVRVQKTDFTSAESLAEAFKDQDVVVDASAAHAEQSSLIDAALKAGVKRWIPSEFGVNTRVLGDSTLAKLLSSKIKTVDYLETIAAENKSFSWTGLSTGAFLDWSFKNGFTGFVIGKNSATIFDSGNEPFRGTNLASVGLAVTLILKNLDVTANKYLNVASHVTTQNEILSVFEEETGAKWTKTHVKTEDLVKAGNDKLAKGDYSAIVEFLGVSLLADGKGDARNAELHNSIIGLPKDDLRETIRTALKG